MDRESFPSLAQITMESDIVFHPANLWFVQHSKHSKATRRLQGRKWILGQDVSSWIISTSYDEEMLPSVFLCEDLCTWTLLRLFPFEKKVREVPGKHRGGLTWEKGRRIPCAARGSRLYRHPSGAAAHWGVPRVGSVFNEKRVTSSRERTKFSRDYSTLDCTVFV